MGEVSELILDGVLCELCGVYIELECGYPRKCVTCTAQIPRKKRHRRKRPGGGVQHDKN